MDISALTTALQRALDRRRSIVLAAGQQTVAPTGIEDGFLDHECSAVVLEVLQEQEELAPGTSLMVNCFNGRIGFQAHMVAALLVREARLRNSVDAAVEWLAKVLGTKSAAGIIVQSLWGVETLEQAQILDYIDLRSFESLPPSRQKDTLQNEPLLKQGVIMPVYSWRPPTSALVARVDISPYFSNTNDDLERERDRQTYYRAAFDDIRLCLAIESRAPVIRGPMWFQYLDPDLEAAIIGAGMSRSHEEINPPRAETKSVDPSNVKRLVRAFMSLSPPLKARTRTAMERLHQAMTRTAAADRALEISIALETLLIDTPGEHTFKIGLRAALMTSDEFTERIQNRATIEAVYGIRSALMHSGRTEAEVKVRGYGKRLAEDVVADATSITAGLIQRVLADGTLPEWRNLELSTGPGTPGST